jgi:hypothetical protein
MRRMMRVGAALALLVYIAALVVLLIPQPCPPAPPGSRFYICIPPNLTRGVLLGLLAAALSALTGLASVYHGMMTQQYRYAAIIGAGTLAIAICFGVGLLAVMPIGGRAGNGVLVTPLSALAPLAILLSPLLAIVTLLNSGAPSRRGSAHSG